MKLQDIDLTDTGNILRLPFGKHEGVVLSEVPAGYLLWLFEQKWCAKKFPEIYDYIEENFDDLEVRASEEHWDEDFYESERDWLEE